MLDVKKAEELFNNFPDVEPLKDFDPFLVGEGSAKFVESGMSHTCRSDQLTGIETFQDLINKPDKDLEDPMEDDLGQFCAKGEVLGNSLDYYYKVKKSCYDMFDFTRVRSENLALGLMREYDIVMSDEDGYLVAYLDEHEISKSRIKLFAQISAWADMGFTEVKYVSKCSCPMCSCLDGLIFPISSLTDSLCSDDTKFSCEGSTLPVIKSFDRLYFNTRTNVTKVTENGISIYQNIPIEYMEEILKIDLEYDDIEFTDLSILKDWSGEVVIGCGHYLLVHNLYIGCLSPLDFLKEWASNLENGCDSSDEVFYIRGKKVHQVGGSYVEVSTGKVLEV